MGVRLRVCSLLGRSRLILGLEPVSSIGSGWALYQLGHTGTVCYGFGFNGFYAVQFSIYSL